MVSSSNQFDPKTASMVKIKAWMRENNVGIPVGASDAALRILVVRRQVRLANSIPGERPIRGAMAASSLAQFKDTLERMNTRNYGPKEFLCFNAKLLFIEPDVTIIRHDAICRGVIKYGRCSTCNTETLGEPNFRCSLVLCDLEDQNCKYNLIGFKAAGENIFTGKTATQVEDMAPEAVADVLEEWSEVPINVHAVVEYDIAKGKTRVSPYNLVRMPIDYLTEYN